MSSPGVLSVVDDALLSLQTLGAALLDVHIPELDLVQVRARLTCWLRDKVWGPPLYAGAAT